MKTLVFQSSQTLDPYEVKFSGRSLELRVEKECKRKVLNLVLDVVEDLEENFTIGVETSWDKKGSIRACTVRAVVQGIETPKEYELRSSEGVFEVVRE